MTLVIIVILRYSLMSVVSEHCILRTVGNEINCSSVSNADSIVQMPFFRATIDYSIHRGAICIDALNMQRAFDSVNRDDVSFIE